MVVTKDAPECIYKYRMHDFCYTLLFSSFEVVKGSIGRDKCLLTMPVRSSRLSVLVALALKFRHLDSRAKVNTSTTALHNHLKPK